MNEGKGRRGEEKGKGGREKKEGTNGKETKEYKVREWEGEE